MSAGTWIWILTTGVPGFILLTGVVEDLRIKKVKNRIVLILMGIAAIASYLAGGMDGVIAGGAGMLTAFMLHVPLVYARVLGAGDMKLMMAFGLATNWETVLTVSLFALLWGALLGLFRSIVSGKIIQLLRNTLKISYARNDVETKDLNQIPYTVALFFGWLSSLFNMQGVFL